jgi:hypothetical protein
MLVAAEVMRWWRDSEIDKIKWHIDIEGTLQDIDNMIQEKFLEILQELSEDVRLKTTNLNMVESESFKIYFEGSVRGFLKIKFLFKIDELSSINGLKVLEVQIDDPIETVPDLIYALKDENSDFRKITASTLGELGPEAKAAMPALS